MNLIQFHDRLDKLDFGHVYRALTSGDTVTQWEGCFADSAIDFYKKFLFLCHSSTLDYLRPNLVTDLVWHAHLSDTEEYRKHCRDLFGFPLVHYDSPSIAADEKCGYLNDVIRMEFAGERLVKFEEDCRKIDLSLLEPATCVGNIKFKTT